MRPFCHNAIIVTAVIACVIAGCGRPPRSIDEAVVQLQEKDERCRISAAVILGDLGCLAEQPAEKRKAVMGLRVALNDTSPSVRAAAACSLGHIGYPAKEAVPDLVKLLHERDDIIRSNSTSSLYLIARDAAGKEIPGAGEALRELRKALSDHDGWIRAHAVGALMAFAPDDQEVIGQAVTMLNDPDMNVRTQTLESLGSLGVKAKSHVPSIRELLHDKDSSVREQAEKTLHAIGEK